MTATIHVALVLLLLVGPGLLPAICMVGWGPVAVVLAPLVTGVACSAAVIISVQTEAPLESWLATVVLAMTVGSVLMLRRSPPRAEQSLTWAQLAFFVAVVAVPLLAVRRAPVDWDARAIWLFHADWFFAGGAKAAAAMANPFFVVSHPDYPPLAPGTAAAVWTILGRDNELAQLTIALLVASSTVAIATALCSVMKGVSRSLTTVTGAALILGAYGLAGRYGTNGYVDLLAAAALTAGAVALLVGRLERDTAALGAVCLAVAMLTKNEATVVGAAILFLTVCFRGWRRGLLLAAGPMLLSVLWSVTARSNGAVSDVTATSHFSDLLRLDPDVLRRVGPTVADLWRRSRWEFLAAATATGIGWRHARSRRRELLGSGWAPLWLVAAACLAFVGVVYVVSPHDLTWYLDTSAARTTLAPRLLLLVECAIWLLVLQVRAPGNREEIAAAQVVSRPEQHCEDPVPKPAVPATSGLVPASE